MPNRLILVVAVAAFALASSIHAGLWLSGWEHSRAATAEGVIAAVLALGLVATWIWPAGRRGIALGILGFALLGTLVGVFTIAVGVGPRTAPDIVYHIVILAVLTWGLVVAARAPVDTPQRASGGAA